MQKKLNLWQKTLLLLTFVAGFAAIRLFENSLFYDPLLAFFKGESVDKTLPHCDFLWLSASYLARYFLNSLLSLCVIYVVFEDRTLVRFAALMFLCFFMFFIVGFFIVLAMNDSSLNMILFYIRRFIIQPVLLLLFIPGFFYQKKVG